MPEAHATTHLSPPIIKTKEKPKHTKVPGTNGHSDKGWTDAGIARFAELIELVRAQRSGNDLARQEDEALEILV